MNHTLPRTGLLIVIMIETAAAQLAGWSDLLPRRDKPPVVFVTGHDAICPDPRSGELPFFKLTFGDFDKVMGRDGRTSLVFEACYAPNRPPIEEVANVLLRFMASLRYEDGEPVPEVDIVAHSMGGLIVRSYLAGKQIDGGFVPPAAPRVRKVVFIGTPHFGTPVAAPRDRDPQVRQMSVGDAFLFDLATWNQGSDDVRGVDALSITGTAGRNGPATDSVVTLTSASMDFAIRERTAVLPYCHTQGGIGQLFLCEGAPGLARVTNEDHPTARLVLAFLNDNEFWRSAMGTAEAHPVLAGTTGLMVQSRTADDLPRPIRSATVLLDSGSSSKLQVSAAGNAYGEMLPAGPVRLDIDGITRRIMLAAGGARALVIKPGPLIEAVEPAPGPSWPLVLAPGMLVIIKGAELNAEDSELYLAGRPVRVLSRTADRLTAVLPEDVAGVAELRLRNGRGQHALRILLERAFPVLFLRGEIAAAMHASSGEPVTLQDPASPGEILSLFLTGLGATTADGSGNALQQPEVTVAGRPCEVLYAGRAMAGIDQINFRVPQNIMTGMSRLRIRSGTRIGSADLPIQ
jgi:uncharacterized protein (TIGR03437 family)